MGYPVGCEAFIERFVDEKAAAVKSWCDAVSSLGLSVQEEQLVVRLCCTGRFTFLARVIRPSRLREAARRVDADVARWFAERCLPSVSERIDPVVQRTDLGVFARRILFMRTGDDGLGFTSAVDAIDQGRFLVGVVAAAKLLHASHAKKVVSKTMEAFLGAGSFQLTHSAILEVMSQHAARAARVGVPAGLAAHHNRPDRLFLFRVLRHRCLRAVCCQNFVAPLWRGC